MKNLLIILVIAATLVAGAAVIAQAPITQVAKPVRVYMIQDTDKDIWYRLNGFGLVSWGPQDQGKVWAVKRQAESAENALRGSRKTKMRTFVLLPLQDKD